MIRLAVLLSLASAALAVATVVYATHRRYPEMTVSDYRALIEDDDGVQPYDVTPLQRERRFHALPEA